MILIFPHIKGSAIQWKSKNEDEQTPLTKAIECYTLNHCPKEVVVEIITSPNIQVTQMHLNPKKVKYIQLNEKLY